MINNTTRGGQILLHKFRMFGQVSNKSLKIALVFSIIILLIDIFLFRNFSLSTLVVLQDWTNFQLEMLGSRLGSAYHKTQFASKYFGQNYELQKLIVFAKQITIDFFVFFTATWFLVVLILNRSGRRFFQKQEAVHLASYKKVNVYLHAKKLKGDFVVQVQGNHFTKKTELLYLPKNFETQHTFITGATGSGKTNLLHNLLPQIRSKGQSAIVIDQSGEMYERYFNPETDLLFNPFHAETSSWDFFAEINNHLTLKALAESLFSPPGREMSENASWYQNAKQIFVDAVTLIGQDEHRSLASLNKCLRYSDVKTLSRSLKGTASAGILFEENTKTSTSLLSVLRSFLGWMEHLPSVDNFFTLKAWIEEATKQQQDGQKAKSQFLFLTSTPTTRLILQPLISMLMDLAVNNLMDLGLSSQRRLWFVIDELAALKKLPILTQSMAELRKYGGCVLTATQTMSQLYDIYGHHQANTIFAQFGTKFIFANKDVAMNKMVSAEFGVREYSSAQESISYGAHEMRDGVSLAEIEKSKLVASVSDIANLAPLECLVTFRQLENVVGKIQTIWQQEAPK